MRMAGLTDTVWNTASEGGQRHLVDKYYCTSLHAQMYCTFCAFVPSLNLQYIFDSKQGCHYGIFSLYLIKESMFFAFNLRINIFEALCTKFPLCIKLHFHLFYFFCIKAKRKKITPKLHLLWRTSRQVDTQRTIGLIGLGEICFSLTCVSLVHTPLHLFSVLWACSWSCPALFEWCYFWTSCLRKTSSKDLCAFFPLSPSKCRPSVKTQH